MWQNLSMALADDTETLRRLAAAAILEGMQEAGLGAIPPRVVAAGRVAVETSKPLD